MKSNLFARCFVAILLVAGFVWALSSSSSAQSGRKRLRRRRRKRKRQSTRRFRKGEELPTAPWPTTRLSPLMIPGRSRWTRRSSPFRPASLTATANSFRSLKSAISGFTRTAWSRTSRVSMSVETPFHVALVLDTSNSTTFKFDDIQDAAFAFIKQLRPDDQVMVVSFDSKVRFHCDFTNDYDALRQAIDETRTGGSTKLYEAVDKVVDRLEQIEGRKAIVLFTDGVDTASRRANYQNTIDKVEESGALVYPIKYDTENDQQGGAPPQLPVPGRGRLRIPPNRRRWPFNQSRGASMFPQWPGRAPSRRRRNEQRRIPPGGALPAGTGRPQRRAALRSRHALQPLAGFFEHSRRAAPPILAQLLPDQREEGRRIPASQSPRRKNGDDRSRSRRLPRGHGCAGDGGSKIEDRDRLSRVSISSFLVSALNVDLGCVC